MTDLYKLDNAEIVSSYLSSLRLALNSINIDEISQVLEALKCALRNEKNIYVIGNGGSASTASHFKNDFSQASISSPFRFKVHCLTDNISIITAIANDFCFDRIFIDQLRDVLKNDDLVIAISTSGNSQNVILASEFVKERGNNLIAMTGFDGGKLKNIADYCLNVASSNTRIIEDVHLVFVHMLIHSVIQSENLQC